MSILNLFVHRLFGSGMILGFNFITKKWFLKTSKYKVTKNPSRKKDPIPKVKLINVARRKSSNTAKDFESTGNYFNGERAKKLRIPMILNNTLKATMDKHVLLKSILFRKCNKIHQLPFFRGSRRKKYLQKLNKYNVHFLEFVYFIHYDLNGAMKTFLQAHIFKLYLEQSEG